MAEHNTTGRHGEQMAAELMTRKGYTVLETNWRMGHLEMDIIAGNRKEIVFVEVKTRTSEFAGTPAEAVDANKRRHMVTAANAYVKYHLDTRRIRFDIIGILLNKAGEIEKIEHFENAFAPEMKTIGSGTYSGQQHRQRRR